jgi:hypothetical protein
VSAFFEAVFIAFEILLQNICGNRIKVRKLLRGKNALVAVFKDLDSGIHGCTSKRKVVEGSTQFISKAGTAVRIQYLASA